MGQADELEGLEEKALKTGASKLYVEDLVDEMLAILSDRDEIMRKKEMEHAQAVINDIYNNGL